MIGPLFPAALPTFIAPTPATKPFVIASRQKMLQLARELPVKKVESPFAASLGIDVFVDESLGPDDAFLVSGDSVVRLSGPTKRRELPPCARCEKPYASHRMPDATSMYPQCEDGRTYATENMLWAEQQLKGA